MCRVRNVKVLMLSQSNIGYKCMISGEANKPDKIESNNTKIINKSFDELQQYLKSFDLSKQIRTYDKKHGRSIKDWLVAASQYIFSSDHENVKTHYNYYGRTKLKVMLYMISVLLKKKYRQNYMNRKLISAVDLSIPFIYFPMAVDLERNLLINAPLYTNQIEIIRSIAKSLPMGFHLYVKENPSQISREWRPISEYKEILSIPNVTLIHPSVSAQKLLQKCSLVVTIAGSSGFESAFYGKPAIVFANVGYSILPSIKKVTDIEQLSHMIEASLQEQVNPADVEKYLILLEKHLVNFDLFGFGSKFKDRFYHGGTLVDVNISQNEMKKFLDEQNKEMTILASAHIEKIRHYVKMY